MPRKSQKPARSLEKKNQEEKQRRECAALIDEAMVLPSEHWPAFVKATRVLLGRFTSGEAAEVQNDLPPQSFIVPTWASLRAQLLKAMAGRGAQNQLAKEIGVTRQSLHVWMQGKSQPGADFALTLLRWLVSRHLI